MIKVSDHDRALRQGACACLELAAKRGPASLEKAWTGFTLKQRALVQANFLETLQREAAQRETF